MRTMLSIAAAALIMSSYAFAQDQTVYEIGNGITGPVLLREVKPRYTEGARQRKVEGIVELKAVVKKDGSVGTLEVVRSLDSELDEQAKEAAAQWKFKPGTKDGEPVNVQVNIELAFTLKK